MFPLGAPLNFHFWLCGFPTAMFDYLTTGWSLENLAREPCFKSCCYKVWGCKPTQVWAITATSQWQQHKWYLSLGRHPTWVCCHIYSNPRRPLANKSHFAVPTVSMHLFSFSVIEEYIVQTNKPIHSINWLPAKNLGFPARFGREINPETLALHESAIFYHRVWGF